MKILVIGGSGHIGKFLTPMLVERGDEVAVASRGTTPVPDTDAWSKVDLRQATYARDDAVWGEFVAGVGAEAVIDIMGTDVPGTYEASARGGCKHLIACGSLWMFGPPRVVPTPPQRQNPCEFSGYALRYEEILATQKKASTGDGPVFSAIMPPNICGPYKIPLDCYGGRSAELHKAHMQGRPVKLPAGCNTLIGPCDAEDIAWAFMLATEHRDAAAGEIFNVGSAYSLAAPQFVEAYGQIYGVEIPVEYVSQAEYYSAVLPDLGANYHFRSHMLPDISKLRSRLGYEPRHTPEQTLRRAVDWMRQQGMI